MTNLEAIPSLWIPLELAMRAWSLLPAELETLANQGVLVVGKDPLGNLYLERASIEDSIHRIPVKQFLAHLRDRAATSPSTQGTEAALTLTAAANVIGVSPVTLRKAVRLGHLKAIRGGAGARSHYKIEKKLLMNWYRRSSVDSLDAFKTARNELLNIK